MCGCDLANDLNLTPATTCHHLEKLRVANLLSVRRSGRRVYYSMRDTELASAVTRSLAALENTGSDGEVAGRNRKIDSRARQNAKTSVNGK
jgi:DNA-binding transcriptional ArsR family regulator